MTAKHTPGPWEARRCPANRRRWIISAMGTGTADPKATIARTANWLDSDSEQEEQANAKLIAAALELLEACKQAWDDTHGLSPSSYLRATTISILEAAIAKAKGETRNETSH